MTVSFDYKVDPARIIFGCGASKNIRRVIEEIGACRTLVLSTPTQKSMAENLLGSLGQLGSGVFAHAAPHTPVDISQEAVAYVKDVEADCVISIGGGSTIGLGKAISYRTDITHVVVPTTYSGSEVTPVLGQTENGEKTTLRSSRVRPDVVIYDPELTRTLPVHVSMVSGLNAIAHAIECLYAVDRTPVSTLFAIEGLKALHKALPAILVTPDDMAARTNALYGAWMCGTVLGQTAMSLHHKACHVLGGSFEFPHAETHAAMLPHTVAYNLASVADLLEPASEIFGYPLSQALFDFATDLGSPLSLEELAIRQPDFDLAASLVTKNAYENPRRLDAEAIKIMLRDAWSGVRPKSN